MRERAVSAALAETEKSSNRNKALYMRNRFDKGSRIIFVPDERCALYAISPWATRRHIPFSRREASSGPLSRLREMAAVRRAPSANAQSAGGGGASTVRFPFVSGGVTMP